jgi:hypothetical protein
MDLFLTKWRIADVRVEIDEGDSFCTRVLPMKIKKEVELSALSIELELD